MRNWGKWEVRKNSLVILVLLSWPLPIIRTMVNRVYARKMLMNPQAPEIPALNTATGCIDFQMKGFLQALLRGKYMVLGIS